MALTRPRLQSADLVLTCPEPSQRTAQPGTPPALTPSTFPTSSSFTAPGVDDTVLGYWCYPEDGNAAFEVRFIKSRSGTTATVDAPWSDTTGVTRIRLFLGPDVPIVVTTADGASLFDVITTRHAGQTNEPDGFWSQYGLQLIKVGGANTGKARLISGFTAVSGTFVDAAADATTVGDVFIARREVKLETDPEVTVDQQTLPRKFIGTGEFGADVPVAITTKASIAFEVAPLPLSAVASGGVQAVRPAAISDLLEDVFDIHRDTGGTVVTADASTIDLNTSALTQGGAVLAPTGELVPILATTNGQDVTTYPAGHLTFGAVPVGGTCHASVWFSRKKTDFRSRTWDIFRGGYSRAVLGGCTPTLKLVIERDQIPRFQFNYTADFAFEYNLDRIVALGAASPLVLNDTATAQDGKGSIVHFGSFLVPLDRIEVDFMLKPLSRPGLPGVNQGDGCAVDVEAMTITGEVLADVDEQTGFKSFVDKIRSGKHQQLTYQNRTAAGKVFWLSVPCCHLLSNSFKHVNRQGMYQFTGSCTNPQPVLGAAFANLPPLSFGMC